MFNGRGKTNAIDDPDNLDPVITYRHVLSSNVGLQRVVGLYDMDCFYAACEQVRLGIDPELPLVVLQWDSLIAVNYPARKYGIARMTKLAEARTLCPHLVVVHVQTYKAGDAQPAYHSNPNRNTHKVSLDHYRRESIKIIGIFQEILVGAEIEKASIDEAFIDFTIPVQQEILKRYPNLASVPQDSPQGLDTPLPPPPSTIGWHPFTNLIPIHPKSQTTADPDPKLTPEPTNSRSTSLEPQREPDLLSEGPITWHDVALNIALDMLWRAREAVRTTLGYTTSAGLARNKFLAKLCASYKKPNHQNLLRNRAIPNYLRPMPFQKIRFLGGKLGSTIAEEYEAKTVSDLLTISLNEMQTKFGPESVWVYQILRGVDTTEVKEKQAISKSMLASKNLPEPIRKDSGAHHWIRMLCPELALRLIEARESGLATWPKSLVLHTRQAGDNASRSKQAVFPFVRDLSGDVIHAVAMKLWKELHGTDATRAAGNTAMKIINISLAFTGLDVMEPGQQGIEDFFRSRSDVVPSLPTRKRTRDAFEATTLHEVAAQRLAGTGQQDYPAQPEETDGLSTRTLTWECPRCQSSLPIAIRPNEVESERIDTIQLEHEDWHFAKDLAREDVVVFGGGGSSTRPPTAKKKRKKESADIASYFNKN